MKKKSVSVFAPATIGNVCVGFDILGLAVNTIGDTVKVTKIDSPGLVEITKIHGVEGLPMDPKNNTATVGLIKLIDDFNLKFGFSVEIKKGIPLGSGMGGSAASAVGAVVAANVLLPKPLVKSALMKYALMGEKIASGDVHGDNVAPCLFGGLCLVRSMDPIDIISIPMPTNILAVLAHPNVRLDTRDARSVLRPEVSLKDFVHQSSHLAGFLSGCYQKNIKLIQDSFADIVIEPQRKHLIPGFDAAKAASLKNKALGFSISGAGPAVFALASNRKSALKIKKAMAEAFIGANVSPVSTWISSVNKKGAYIL